MGTPVWPLRQGHAAEGTPLSSEAGAGGCWRHLLCFPGMPLGELSAPPSPQGRVWCLNGPLRGGGWTHSARPVDRPQAGFSPRLPSPACAVPVSSWECEGRALSQAGMKTRSGLAAAADGIIGWLGAHRACCLEDGDPAGGDGCRPVRGGSEPDLLEVRHMPEGIQLHGRLVLPQLAAPGLVKLPEAHLQPEKCRGRCSPGRSPGCSPGGSEKPSCQAGGKDGGVVAQRVPFPLHPALLHGSQPVLGMEPLALATLRGALLKKGGHCPRIVSRAEGGSGEAWGPVDLQCSELR